ncbi:MAG: AzlC family ABC transporter permease [Chloroflexi bacterium]|nr:AzlC family ABC transporter permease [Chloroflexota bacterium]
MSSSRSEFFAGFKAQLPLMVGVIPFGLIYGALAIQLNVPAPIAQGMSSIIFAGSAQFIGAPLVAAATPGIIIVLTVFVVNLRHALYSASVAPYLKPLHPLWKVALAYLLTDEAYAIAITHYQAEGDGRHKHWFFLGTGLALWLCWQASTAVGIFIGAQVPSNWSLDFALPLTFIAIVIPMLKNRAYGIAALVAGVVGVATIGLQYKLGLMLAAILGITVGMIVEAGRSESE